MRKHTRVLFTTLAVIFFLSVICFVSVIKRNSITALSTSGFFQKQPKEAPEYLPGRYTAIIDEQENVLSMMSRAVYVGDEIYTSEGKIYRLDKVRGDRAFARFLGIDPQIVAFNEFYASQEVPVIKGKSENKPAAPANFAIYHTHSDESYIPSDGVASISFKGTIYKVGVIMAETLRKAGMEVNHDQTLHDPHDNNAYVRSRRTAAKLLSTNPVAMFDVHRDGVPDPNFYKDKVSGKDVAIIRLVVGRQNPRMSANLDFARQILTAVNSIHPNVVKEIFVGKGDYNQDLTSTALLIAAGTHTNSKEEAERGMSLFTEAVPAVLGVTGGAPTAAAPTAKPPAATGGSWKAVGWILGITLVLGLGYLFITSGSTANMKKNMSNFGREITGLFSMRGAARKPGRRERGGQDNDNQE